jgi:hypothetical protein
MINFAGLRVFVIAASGFVMAFCGGVVLGQSDSSSAASSSGTSTSVSSSSGTGGTGSASSAPAPAPVDNGGSSGGGGLFGTGLFAPSPFELSIAVREGYDDNVDNLPTNKQGSAFTSGNIDASYKFGTSRTQMSLTASVGGTYYYDRVTVQNYDIDLHGELKIQHKASDRLTLEADLYGAFLTEPNIGFGAGVNRRSGNYFYTSDRFSLGYQWLPRFSTLTSYTVAALYYDTATLGLFENRVQNIFGNEFRFALQPTTTLVGEYRFGLVNYEHDGDVIVPALIFFGFQLAPAIRLQNNSHTHYVLGGIDHTFSPRFVGTIRAGAEFRDYEAGPSKAGPYVETSLNYAAGKRSTFSWTNRYGIAEPDIPGVASRKTYLTGVQLKQELIPRLSATAGIYFEHNKNDSIPTFPPTPAFVENSFDISISGHYQLTHRFGADLGYQRVQVLSDLSFLEYDRNRFYGGLNIAF